MEVSQSSCNVCDLINRCVIVMSGDLSLNHSILRRRIRVPMRQIASGSNFRGTETASLFPLSIMFSSNRKIDHNLEQYPDRQPGSQAGESRDSVVTQRVQT